MFQSLSDRLSQSLRSITGKARLTEENIQETLREVRMALLEADVALPVVKQFVESVKQRALGQEVMKSLSPGQAFLHIDDKELRTFGLTQPVTLAHEALNQRFMASMSAGSRLPAACFRRRVLSR